ncbi:hypothetical protein SAMN06314042_1123 [Epsilonproteobacteria bacterium SCGC AD-308-O04]|nr:hypothetical protein SAMN06314042_1123 [Epsilonproteobacteria bacterium SCGC AD-308-O04]
MNVTSYIFQSPYPSPVQVGRADTSSTQGQSTQKDSSAEIIAATDESSKSAESFQATQTQEVKPAVEAGTLDTYA